MNQGVVTLSTFVKMLVKDVMSTYLRPANMRRYFDKRPIHSNFERRVKRAALSGRILSKWHNYRPELDFLVSYIIDRLSEETTALLRSIVNHRATRMLRRRLSVVMLIGVSSFFLHRKFGRMMSVILYDDTNLYANLIHEKAMPLDHLQFDVEYMSSPDFKCLHALDIYRVPPSVFSE